MATTLMSPEPDGNHRESELSDAAMFRMLLDSLGDGVYYTDRKRKILFWNRAAEALSGYSAEEVVGRGCADNILMHIDTEGVCICTSGQCPLLKCFHGECQRVERLYLHHKAGHRVPVRVCASPVRDADGCIIGGLETFHDISSEMSTLQELRTLKQTALLCALTGVGNRRCCDQMIEAHLGVDRPDEPATGILFIDVDDFKSINDRFGHQVGDAALKMVANTLVKDLRDLDFVGRWGGEEFLAILPRVGQKALAEAAERLRKLVASSSAEVSGGRLSVTVSIGATLRQLGESPGAVVERADALMYASKSAGKNQTTVG